MAMQTDVQVTSLGSSGVIFEGRTRVKGMLIAPTGSAGNVTLTDGGTNVFAVQTTANGETFNALVPGQGVLFQTNVAAILVNASVTVFYG
jgi:cold shock CspA family protein